MGWSYQLLLDEERIVFDRLSVFAGGFDVTAAEEVCAGASVAKDDVLDLLASLVDKSMVVAERAPAGVGTGFYSRRCARRGTTRRTG